MIELGFRAFDPHELLPHALAARCGLFTDAQLSVRLCDLTFEPRELPQVSCGAALLARLRGDEVLRIVLVASRRPLFWLMTPADSTRASAKRVASYPTGSPPALFARALLPSAEQVAARDDDARLGLLLAGEVDGAIVGSAPDPARLAAAGLERSRAFADTLAVPTTGLAVPEKLLGDPAVMALTSALRAALSRLHDDPDEVARTLVDRFRYSATSAVTGARDFASVFSTDGRIERTEAEEAIATAAAALGVPALAVEDVYDRTVLS